MSNLIGVEPVVDETPTVGLRPNPSAGEAPESLGPNTSVGEEPSMDTDVPSDGSEEGELQDDPPVSKKRKRSPSIEEQPPPKRVESGPEPTIDSFGGMMYPPRRIPCIISIGQNAPFGSLYPANAGLAVLLFIDPGRFGPPTVQLGFRLSGTETGTDFARNTWDVDSRYRGQWSMDHVEHAYAVQGPSRSSFTNPTVLRECTSRDTGNLMYMRFKSWSQAGGFYRKNAFSDQSTGIRKSLKDMFHQQDPYLLELWFIAPFEASLFRKHCLRYFSDSIAQRGHPLKTWKDKQGESFNYASNVAPPASLAKGGYGQLFHQPTLTANPRKKLAAQHPETSIPTLGVEAKVSDPSTPPPPEAHPIPETLLLPASGVGTPSAPTDESLIDFEMPTTMPSLVRGPVKGFMPPSWLNDADIEEDSEPDIEADPGTGSNGDRDKEHDDQGENDGRPA